MALDAGTVVGGYVIEGVLGRGGMATVYSARHREHGRRVALKVLAGDPSNDPEFVARFQREGRLQASIQHPHVVTVFEAGESEHGLYLAMQLVPGSTLAALMEERALDSPRSLELLRQVAEALDVAHAAKLVHRDVKPQNVLVGDSDDAYLGDFGLTRLGGADGVTATGKLLGTISYIAPEVIRGGEAVPASDRYAFAAMAFECLTGTVVYPRRSEAAILFAHSSEPPPRASGRRPELPAGLDEVFQRALSKDPGERPASATALAGELAGTLERGGGGAGPASSPGAAALEEPTVEPIPLIAPPAPRPARVAGVRRRGCSGRQWPGRPWRDRRSARRSGTMAPARRRRCRRRSRGRRSWAALWAGRDERSTARAAAHGADSPGCTIVQSALPGHAVVVPEDGVIRRWSVRSARGELALAIVRPRGADTFQVARSRNEFAGNGGVYVFDANLAVERGDLVGLVVYPGSAAGARSGVEGARTRRWIPLLPYGKKPVDRGFANELLLRVDYVRGGQQRVPHQVTGAAAEKLKPGRVVKRRRLRFASGRRVEIALVSLGNRFALDEFLGGRRTARIGVPADMRPGAGRILTFWVDAPAAAPETLQIGTRVHGTRQRADPGPLLRGHSA